MSPNQKATALGSYSSTFTILATDRPGQAGDSARVCSRCGGNIERHNRLIVVLWNQFAFVYCGTCRKRMGV